MLNISRPQLNPTQLALEKAVLGRHYRRIVWIGAYRSGKGVGTANALIKLAMGRAMRGGSNCQYLVAGQTLGSFRRNNEQYLYEAAEHWGLTLKHVGGELAGYDLDGIARFYLFGGGNARSFLPVRGLTLDAAWIDEATLVDEEFVRETERRLTFADSQVILTSNSGNIYHWLKQQWIDNPGKVMEGKTLCLTSMTRENQYYPEERLEEVLADPFKTESYRQAVYNEWTLPEGLVYPIPQSAIVHQNYTAGGECFVDPGTAGVTAALYCVNTKQATGGNTWLVAKEYYHVGDKQGRLSDLEHINRIIKAFPPISRWHVDPAAANFRLELGKRGLSSKPFYNKSWDTGVRVANNALQAGLLTINDTCSNLLGEASALQWNERGTTNLPGPDHACDDLKALAMDKFPTEFAEWLR